MPAPDPAPLLTTLLTPSLSPAADGRAPGAANPCSSDAQVCSWVYDHTTRGGVAEAADWLVGKPLALIGFLVFGLVLRWVLHRLVDRVVLRAGGGLEGVVAASRGRWHRARSGRSDLVPAAAPVSDPAAPTGPLGPDGTVAADAEPSPAATSAAAMSGAVSGRRLQRAKTIGDLFKSIVTGVLVAIIGTMMLSEVGVNIAPIIASAGVVGVALGFGAQSLVRDFLTGVFMIVEDQYGVGDVVNVGEATGTVEAVSLRVTRLRSLDGTVWYVPNGEILRVGNLSQNWSRAVVDVGVAYDSDLERVQQVLREIGRELMRDPELRGYLIEEPEVTGVESLSADSIDLRLMVKTVPLQNWKVARELRQRIKARFDREGIEIPFAQRVVWHRQEVAEEAAERRTTSTGTMTG